MDLSTYKPSLLQHDKFAAAEFVLESFSNEHKRQKWKSEAYSISLAYSDDLMIVYANNSITLETITEDSCYWKYRNFTPDIIQQKNAEGQEFQLSHLSEDLLHGGFKQLWNAGDYSIFVSFDDKCEISEYMINDYSGEGCTSTRYYPDGTLIPSDYADEDEPRTFSTYLREIVGESGLSIFDGECITGTSAYIDILNDLKTLTNPVIDVEYIKVHDHGATWKVDLKVNGVAHDFSVNGDTDWFDDNFIQQINVALRKSGSAYTFYSVIDDDYGQGMGIVYLHDSVAASIAADLEAGGEWAEWEGFDNFVDYSSGQGSY